VAIISFDFDPSLREAFLDLGYDIYGGDPAWIPPLRADLRRQLAPEFPFYSQPGNRCRHFLATAGGKWRGRVAAMVNSALRDRDRTPVGTVGFFESEGDYGVAQDLLEAATFWLRTEGGVNRIWGPMNFDIWHGYRFMTAGFNERPLYGEPYNKPNYPEYFRRYGFVDRQHWHSLEVAGRRSLEGIISFGTPLYRELVKGGYRFESLQMANFSGELMKLHTVLPLSYHDFLGYTPISAPEFAALYAGLRHAADPRFFVFAYDNDGALAGFAGAFLELADAVRVLGGKDTHLGRIRFLLRRRRTDRINFYIIGLTPTEAARRRGLGRAMTAYVLRQVVEAGYEIVLFSLIVAGSRSRGLLGRDVPAPQRQYTLFELNL
jgi:GNAT superfamily N-acetyltransferase